MMKSGTLFKQGEIAIVPLPFTDLSGTKQRPVLILSKTDYNGSDDIITCGITSNLKDAEHSVIIDNKNLSEGQIPITSRIKVDKLFTLEKSLVRKIIGRINNQTFEMVKKEFINLI